MSGRHSEDLQPPAAAGRRTRGVIAFWWSLAVGWAIMAFGVRGLFHEAEATNPAGSARLFLGAALVHDLVLAPLVLGVGLLVGRLVPERARAVVQGGLIVSGVVALFSYPFVRGFGRAPTNPSALPANYGRGLAAVLTAIWLAVGLLLWWHRSKRNASRGVTSPTTLGK